MTPADIQRIHAEQKRSYEDECAMRGLFNGVLIGVCVGVGFYGFIRLMVALMGSGK